MFMSPFNIFLFFRFFFFKDFPKNVFFSKFLNFFKVSVTMEMPCNFENFLTHNFEPFGTILTLADRSRRSTNQ